MIPILKSAILAEMTELSGKFPIGDPLYELYSPERLQTSRYDQCVDALGQMGKRGFQVHPDTFPKLMQIQLQTQMALFRNGLTGLDTPKNLPCMNTLFIPREPILTDKPVVVEVMSPPKAGTTSSINYLQERFKPPLFVTQEASQHAHVKRGWGWEDYARYALQGLRVTNFPKYFTEKDESIDYELSNRILNGQLFRAIDRISRGVQLNVPIVADRWNMDSRVFARAKFLRGKMSQAAFEMYGSVDEEMTAMSRFLFPNVNYALILCMAPPSTCIKRNNDKYGKITNPDFLPTVYEQYMCFHLLMSESKKPFLYACLDFSSEDESFNQKLFAQTLQDIFDCYHSSSKIKE